MLKMLVCVATALALTAGAGTVVYAGKDAQDVHGKIVKVNTDDNVVVIRVGDGDKAKEMKYKVANTTKFWGTDKQALNEGLKYKGFREGTEVWFRTGTGADAMTITELRFFNPGTTSNKERD
jgi:hypothetical protein